jgi:hypothetical protein
MAELYFSTNVDNDVELCISPLTDSRAASAGLENALGYFLYERCHSDNSVAVIARVHSEEAVLRLSQILGME